MNRRPCGNAVQSAMSGLSTPRSGQEIRVAFIELFDLGGRFDGRRRSDRDSGQENDLRRRESSCSAKVSLLDGRKGHRQKHKDQVCRKRQQYVNNFLERPRGWKALSYHLSLSVIPPPRSNIGRRSRRANTKRQRRSHSSDQERLDDDGRVRVRTSQRRADKLTDQREERRFREDAN